MHIISNRISAVIVSELASSALDHGFEPRSGQTKDNKIGIANCRYFLPPTTTWHHRSPSDTTDLPKIVNLQQILCLTTRYYMF